VYGLLIGSVIANPLLCAVAPIIALDSTRACEVPAIGSRGRMCMCIHHLVIALDERHGQLRIRCGDGAEAGDGERRVVGGVLALEAHGCGLKR